jgi:hypothetical protein
VGISGSSRAGARRLTVALGCMRRNRQLTLFMALGAVAGIFSVIAPYVLLHGFTGEYQSPLFPLLRNAWEELEVVPTVVLLVGAGVGLGFMCPKHWLILGASTAFLFPLAAVLEMAKDPRSHNLWPLEFVLYIVVVAGPAILGALVGSMIRGRREHAT